MMFHRHSWGLSGERYTPRDESMTYFDGKVREETYLMVSYGLTVITQRCYRCGVVRVETVPGRTHDAR